MNFGHKPDGLATLLAVTQNTCQRQKRSHVSAQNMLRCFLFCMVVSFRSYSQNVAFPKQIKKKIKGKQNTRWYTHMKLISLESIRSAHNLREYLWRFTEDYLEACLWVSKYNVLKGKAVWIKKRLEAKAWIPQEDLTRTAQRIGRLDSSR